MNTKNRHEKLLKDTANYLSLKKTQGDADDTYQLIQRLYSGLKTLNDDFSVYEEKVNQLEKDFHEKTTEISRLKKDRATQEIFVNYQKNKLLNIEQEYHSAKEELNTNIDQLIEKNQELEESQNFNQSLLNHIKDGITVIKNRKITFVNNQMFKITGFAPNELKQKSGMGIAAPFETERLTKIYTTFRQNNSLPNSIEFWAVKKNGELCYLLNRYATIKSYDYYMIITTDLTKRKLAEDKLKEQEIKFRELAENTNDVFIKQNNQEITYINPNFEKLFGRNSEELKNNPEKYFRWLHDQDVETVKKARQKLIDKQKNKVELQYRIICPDSSIKWIWTRQNILWKDENTYQIITVSSDITKQKISENQLKNYKNKLELLVKERTEELSTSIEELNATNEMLRIEVEQKENAQKALSESEAIFRNFITQSSEGISIVNQEGQIIKWNQTMENIFKIPFEDVKDTFIWDFEYKFLPFEKRTSEKYLQIKKMSLEFLTNPKNQRMIEMEGEFSVLNQKIFLHLTIFPIKIGNTIFAGRIIRNITQQKNDEKEIENYRKHLEVLVKKRTNELQISEQRFKFAVEATTDGIWDWNIKTNQIYFSPRYYTIINYAPNEFPAQIEEWEKRIHPKDKPEVLRVIYKQISKENDHFNIEYRMETKEKKWLWIQNKGKIVEFDTNKNPLRIVSTLTDIHQRKDWEKRLKDSEQFLKDAQQIAKLGSWKMNIKTGQIEWSDETYRIFDLEKTTPLTNELFANCVHPEDTKKFQEYSQKHFKEDNIKYEYRIITPLGNVKHLEHIGYQKLDKNGKLESLFGTIMDISERKLNEKIMIENEQKYKTIFENVNNSIILMNQNCFLDCNTKTLEIFNCTKEDLIGRSINNFSPYMQSENIISEFEINQKIKDTIDVEKQNFEWVFIRKGGKKFEADVSLNKVFINQHEFIIAIINDISQQKAAQRQLENQKERYQALFDLAVDGIVVANQEGLIINANESAAQIIGYPKEELIGKYYSEFTDKKSLEKTPPRFDLLEQGQKVINERTLIQKNGNKIIVETQIKKLPDERLQAFIRDVTQKREYERKLKESEAFLKSIIENIPFDFWARDKNNICFLQNKPSIEMWGDLINKKSEEINIEENIKKIWHKNNEKAFNGEIINKEIEIVRKNKKYYFQNIIAPILNNDNIIGILGINIDISTRKNTEIALKISEERLRRITNSAGLFIYRMSIKTGKYEFMNDTVEQLFGYNKDYFMTNPFIIRKIIHPDWQDYFEKEWKKLEQGIIEPYYEYQVVHKNGTIKWLYQQNLLIKDKNGVPFAIEGIVSDITERKNTEEKIKQNEQFLQKLLDNLPLPIYLKNKNYQYIYANKKFQELFGIEKQLSVIGKDDFDIFPANIAAKLMNEDQIVIKAKQNVNYQKKLSIKNKERTFDTSKILFYDDKNNLSELLSIFSDITDLKETERKILDAIIETEERERKKFAEDLHDGLGPLLSSIKMYVKFLIEKKDSNQKQEIINNLFEVIDETINNVKTISSLLSPHILMDFGLLTALKTFAEKIKTSSKLDIQILSNKYKNEPENKIRIILYRITTELLNNTLKYANAHTVKITLFILEDYIRLYYSDDGIGFDKNKILQDSSKRGLGLFNIENRIKSLGGTLLIDTMPGKGMKVEIEVKNSTMIEK